MITPKTLYFDIETSPCLATCWGTGKTHISDEQILEPTRIICLSYKWAHESKVHHLVWDQIKSDKKLCQDFSYIISEADLVVGHNGKSFDIKTINARIAFHCLPPIPETLVDDTLQQARTKFRLPSMKLRYLAKYFDLTPKAPPPDGLEPWKSLLLDPVDSDRYTKYMKHMLFYCDQDALTLEELHLRIAPYVKSKLNRNLFFKSADGEVAMVCPGCGYGEYSRRGYNYSQVRKTQRFQCKSCFKMFTDGINLLVNTPSIPRH